MLKHSLASGRQLCSAQELAPALTARGHSVALVKSAGGGVGTAAFRNLRHTFISVLAAPGGAAAPQLEFIVDPHFACAFQIASPCARYAALQQMLPQCFVGSREQLVNLVEWVSRWVALLGTAAAAAGRSVSALRCALRVLFRSVLTPPAWPHPSRPHSPWQGDGVELQADWARATTLAGAKGGADQVAAPHGGAAVQPGRNSHLPSGISPSLLLRRRREQCSHAGPLRQRTVPVARQRAAAARRAAGLRRHQRPHLAHALWQRLATPHIIAVSRPGGRRPAPQHQHPARPLSAAWLLGWQSQSRHQRGALQLAGAAHSHRPANRLIPPPSSARRAPPTLHAHCIRAA